MTNSVKSLAVLALCAAFGPASGRAEAPRAGPAANRIDGIGVSDTAGGVELEIRGERAPSYTVFKLQDPPRLVVDLAGADVSAVSGPVVVGRGGVREVTTAQYTDEKSSVGRVIVALESAGARYEVTPRGQAVVVKVMAGSALSPALSRSAGEGVQGTPGVHGTLAISPSVEESGTPAFSPSVHPDNVLARRVDEAEVEHAATAITSARASGGGALIALDGEVARFEVIELANPPRLALDLYGITRAPRSAVSLSGPFKQARFADRREFICD